MDAGTSPSLNPLHLPTGRAPPTPPQSDPLEDIYGSAPTSPVLAEEHATRAHEILSDLPSRQRALDTDAYREGFSSSKALHVQEGFDEGYALGANLGLLIGSVLGMLQGLEAALRSHDCRDVWMQIQETETQAKGELALQQLLGQEWVDEEGIWKWDVEGKEDEVTFKEVSEQHPIVRKWMAKVRELATSWGVDLEAVEPHHITEEQKPRGP